MKENKMATKNQKIVHMDEKEVKHVDSLFEKMKPKPKNKKTKNA